MQVDYGDGEVDAEGVCASEANQGTAGCDCLIVDGEAEVLGVVLYFWSEQESDVIGETVSVGD